VSDNQYWNWHWQLKFDIFCGSIKLCCILNNFPIRCCFILLQLLLLLSFFLLTIPLKETYSNKLFDTIHAIKLPTIPFFYTIDLLADTPVVDWHSFQLPKDSSSWCMVPPYEHSVLGGLRLKPWSSCLVRRSIGAHQQHKLHLWNEKLKDVCAKLL